MSDAIQEKVLIAKQWCENAKGIYLAQDTSLKASVESNQTYCESGALIAGNDTEAKRADAELQNAMKAGNPVEAFKKAPLNGCLSVMTMARISAGFNPTKVDDEKAAEKFAVYSEKLQNAPFFHLKSSDVSHFEHKEKSWDNIVNSILNLYEGISSGDKESVKESIGNMASAAMNQAGMKQTKNLFVQSTIDYASEIKVYVFWTNIEMTYESGKSTSTQEKVDLSKLELQFDKVMWPYYAETVLKYNVSFIEKWLEENKLPPEENVRERVCFCRDLPKKQKN